MRNNPDDLANQKLEKIREIVEWKLFRGVDWDSLDVRKEFQAIIDLIDKED